MILLFLGVLITQMSFAAFQPVDLNNASKEQIMALPGVGDKLARRIIEHRDRNGPFRSLEDLLLIEGCKGKILEKISDKILFSPRKNKKIEQKINFKTDLINKKHLSDDEIRELILNFKSEPKVQKVQEQAVNYAHATPKVVDSWKNRIRQAAWAPRLTTSGGRDLDRDESVRTRAGDTGIIHQKGSINWNFDIKAEWHLSDLIFNRDEIYVSRESVRQNMLRQEILEDVTRIYFERRRLQVLQTLNIEENTQEKVLQQLKIQELTARLDGFTGGWFSEQIYASETALKTN